MTDFRETPGTPEDVAALKQGKEVNVWNVEVGSGMHYGGYALGWYWDTEDDDEPHGPYGSEQEARAAARIDALPASAKTAEDR